MDQTLKNHEDVIEEHDSEICHIRQDLVDIKTRLGIKDLTNGQVVEYQKRLADAIDEEKRERKEQDKVLREDIKAVDDKTWTILTGIIILGILAIIELLLQLVIPIALGG